MPNTRHNDPIAEWRDGDEVTGFAFLRRKERRRDRAGKDYLDLDLGDASGAIVGKVWGQATRQADDYEENRFVYVAGQVFRYRDQLQLRIESCREATEEDRGDGFDEQRLVPTTPYDVDELWARLESLLRENLEDPLLARLATETLAEHGEALKRHPAAKSIHHAYRGGLLEHVVSMLELTVLITSHYRELDRDLMLVAVLFHDLGKVREIGRLPGTEYTHEGRMIGHVVMGRDLLRERCTAIPGIPAETLLHLEHLVLSHQGRREYGSPVEPMTAEAVALHMIDDLDAKLAQIRSAGGEPGAAQFVRGFGRHLYTGGAPVEVDEADD